MCACAQENETERETERVGWREEGRENSGGEGKKTFLTQELNLRLLHWQMDSLPVSHQGSPTSEVGEALCALYLGKQSLPSFFFFLSIINILTSPPFLDVISRYFILVSPGLKD